MSPETLLFPPYSSFILAGKSRSGKTEFLLNFLKNHEKLGHADSYSHVYICFREPQRLYEEIVKCFDPTKTSISFFHGYIPEDIYEAREAGPGTHNLIIIDDLFSKAFDSSEVEQLFTFGRHKKCTVFLTTQNLFPPRAKHASTISRNANYIVLFRCRDLSQLTTLSVQLMGPKMSDFLAEAYRDAIKNYSFLIIDCSCVSDDSEAVQFRSNIFCGDSVMVYQPKNKREKK